MAWQVGCGGFDAGIHSLFTIGPEMKKNQTNKKQSASNEIERYTIKKHMWKRIKHETNVPVSGIIYTDQAYH